MPASSAINPKTGRRYNFVDPAKQQNAELRQIEANIGLLERKQRALLAHDNLLTFTQFTMPDPEAPSDVNRTKYEAAPFHKAVAAGLEEVERGETPQLIFCMPPRHGKCCAHDTPVLTPAGWRTHGELRPGDSVYGPDGRPTKIVAVSADVDEVAPVTFSNGEVVRCHPNHEWTVYDRAQRDGKRWRTLETRDIAKRVLRNGPPGRGGRFTLQLPEVSALDFPAALLPLQPYVLGAWLGDGSSSGPRLAHAQGDQEVVDAVEACGYPASRRWSQLSTQVGYAEFCGKRGVGSEMQRALRGLNVLNDKHVPELYLRASVEQRLQLLAGLVDTDGHVEAATGRVRFSTCSGALRDGVYDLCSTLGFKPYVAEVQPTTSSSGIVGRKVVYQVGFQPTRALPTRIPRKQIQNIAQQRRVSIVAVGPVEKGAARSIQVARADGLYIVGRQLVPTHNSELATRRLAAWYSGRHPSHDVIVAAAGDTLAHDFGSDVRAIMQSPSYRQVFPNYKLRRGGTAKDNIQTTDGGRLIFAGRGGQINGRGAHLMLIDDLYKDHEEARSQTIRDQAWNWFTKVALYRRMGKKLTIITMTRWHSDDIIGRLTDPENPHYNAEEAKTWKIIRLPGLAEDDDPLGRAVGEPLWPERYDLAYHLGNQRRDPMGFASLTQQRPSVADGVLYRRENIKYYNKGEEPEGLRYYASSDHAVGVKQRNDPSCFLKGGMDRQGSLYLTECFWQRVKTDLAVEAMLAMARGEAAPLLWWAEKGHISQSIGPFLYKRMTETNTYINIREVTPIGDKEQRSQTAAAMVGVGRIYFPRGEIWVERAINELMAFPNGNHDDFADALALLCNGLRSMFGAGPKPEDKKAEPAFGTGAWLKLQNKLEADAKDRAAAGGF